MELSLGAVCLGGDRCRFRVWAPLHERVDLHLLGPGARTIPLERTNDGYHEAIADGVRPGRHYRYRLPGGMERPDPASRLQPDGVHGPSEVVADDFAWHDGDWAGLPLPAYVIYELHVGTFTPEGRSTQSCPGSTPSRTSASRPSSSCRSHNSQAVAIGAMTARISSRRRVPMAVRKDSSDWWTHATGVVSPVVLDVVYNHLGPEGNYLADYAPYFTDRYKTDWAGP